MHLGLLILSTNVGNCLKNHIPDDIKLDVAPLIFVFHLLGTFAASPVVMTELWLKLLQQPRSQNTTNVCLHTRNDQIVLQLPTLVNKKIKING